MDSASVDVGMIGVAQQCEIRWIAAGDKPAFLGLWRHYLDFYDVTLTPDVTEATWQRLLDPASALGGRVALREGRLAAFALHVNHASTWVTGDDCYLEDLFVDPALRGSGLGRALIDDLIALARARGWQRLYWHTAQDNARARRLYDSYVLSDDHIRYRIAL
ncbi:GNAT family N-acetyltransferase [Neotabrizicola sp. sgz301269]|uniref:GNAT family N-acetyltransferase n=1 Tax=Neotabrizicola sp. sgz301269 TaxID=3276282 RepID=UPI00376F53B6